ncbi:hypothetical protein UY3_01720 [Chelonia mydas]|uniref:Uncharacterized protein n=1 Tax=Chelonia mydas TaxID=8469 RepID=M7BTB5_CHEMY|nr:hypothetical protein UY3_01720 [Chelonia mydas]
MPLLLPPFPQSLLHATKQLIGRYVKEGRFRIEERTLTAFQWLYSPHQHHIVSRADLASPSSPYVLGWPERLRVLPPPECRFRSSYWLGTTANGNRRGSTCGCGQCTPRRAAWPPLHLGAGHANRFWELHGPKAYLKDLLHLNAMAKLPLTSAMQDLALIAYDTNQFHSQTLGPSPARCGAPRRKLMRKERAQQCAGSGSHILSTECSEISFPSAFVTEPQRSR